jgi:polyhydroxyalkanoate synthesis regulator phasin
MSNDKPTGNAIFDIWLDSQAQFLDAQSQWMQPKKTPDTPFMNADFLDRSVQSWQRCEEQYNLWMKTAENWVSGGAKQSQPEGEEGEEDMSAQALTYLLNPTTFMRSGFEMMDKVFRKLVNGPEFADIGMLEKKLLRSGQDWQAFRAASQRYQEVISAAWLRAYQHFSDEFFDKMQDGNISTEQTLQRWLKIADDELIKTLRSPDFLEAQKDLFATGATYKLKYRELVEMWCESHTIPTRSEVDDMHKLIYELRREVRALKRQIQKSAPNKKAPNAKARAKSTGKGDKRIKG